MPVSEARRIGIVLHDFAAGGTERIAVRLAGHWQAEGRAVTIFCGVATGPARAGLAPGVTVIEATPRLPRGFRSQQRLGRALRQMIAAHPVDVLVAPGNFHLPVLRAAGSLPCPVVCKLSNPLSRQGRPWVAQRLFEHGLRGAARNVTAFVAMSPALAAEARLLVPNPVDVLAEPILGEPALPHRPAAPPMILCAARMVPQKRLDLALAAFAAGPADARLVLLGDGPLRGDLEAQARALGLADRVHFAGHVPDIAPWLAQASAFLLTSEYEGYPAVLVESIAAGVPVVTTYCSPAIREQVDDASFGRVVDASPAAIAAGVAAVLAGGPVDDARRAALIDRHDARRCAAAWLAFLDGVVAGAAA